MNRVKAQVIFACLLIFSSFIVGLTVAQTPPTANTLDHGDGINMPTVTATDGYFYGVTNITDRLFGDYSGLPLTGTTLDTGQGANELYDMDQNVLTSSDVQFNSVNAIEYFLDTDNKTDLFAYPQQDYDYIFTVDNSTGTPFYEAKNGGTGLRAFSGADFSTIINDVIQSFPTALTTEFATKVTGGYIFLSEGIYVVTAPIYANISLTLVGENPATTYLRLADNSDCDVIIVGNDSPTLQWPWFVTIENLKIDGNKAGQTSTNLAGIRYINKCSDFSLNNVYIEGVDGAGVHVEYGWYGRFSKCWFESNRYGLVLNTTGTDSIMDLSITQSTLSVNTINGLYMRGNIRGFYVEQTIITHNYEDGIYISQDFPGTLTPKYVTFSDCRIFDNSWGVTNTYSAIVLDTYETGSLYTKFVGCDILNTDAVKYQKYLFEVDEWTVTKGVSFERCSLLKGNGALFLLKSTIVNIPTKTFQFTEPIVGAISVTSPTGVDVDAATEGALVWGQLPAETQQVVRIKVWAVATGTPIGAGGQMHLAVTFNAGASNAAYNTATKSWTLANFDGEEADYVANDVVHWVIEDGDVGNELLNLLAGDSFEFFALYNAGADPDGATDAVFRCIEIEYV